MDRYTTTFLWLQLYDEGLLKEPGGFPGGILPTPKAAMASIQALKQQLMAKGEASELFANMSQPDSLGAIFGNLEQTVFGKPAYPTVESKAAHLLYFVMKTIHYRRYRSPAWTLFRYVTPVLVKSSDSIRS